MVRDLRDEYAVEADGQCRRGLYGNALDADAVLCKGADYGRGNMTIHAPTGEHDSRSSGQLVTALPLAGLT